MITVTQDDIKAINQTEHIIKYKIGLLDEYLLVTSEVTASAKDVTFNIDAESDMRRTGTVTLIVDDSQWVSENFELGWMDKFIRFSVGIMYDGNYRWYALGTLIATSDAFNYDEVTNELQLTLTDIMGYLNTERGSQIGTSVKIPMDSIVKNQLEATIARWSLLKRTEIDDFPDVIPYDLDFSEGIYPYEILSKVLSLFPWYEQYFDADGVYRAGQIPMRMDDPCALYADDINSLIISEKRSLDFSNIKNTTEIWGKRIQADYVATNCQLVNNSYVLSFLVTQEAVESNKKYCFTPDADSPANPSLTFTLSDGAGGTTTTPLPLYDSDGTALEAGAMVTGVAYVARCLLTVVNNEPVQSMYLMGQKAIHVIVREMNVRPTAQEMISDKARNACDDIRYIINPDSPYACDRYNTATVPQRYSIQNGEIRQVLKDGDYASIYTTKLAYDRGEYENYLKCRMNTAVELTTILIPWLDVNQKIEYTSPTTGQTNQYIVKSINMDASGFKMTMKLCRFYNYYPYDEGDYPAALVGTAIVGHNSVSSNS